MTTSSRSLVEGASKVGTVLSVAGIIVLQAGIYPGLPWPLRLLLMMAVAMGWVAGKAWPNGALVVVAGAAPLWPSVLAGIGGTADPSVHSVWLAGLVAVLLPRLSWTRWQLPGLWRVLLGGWALVLVLAWPVLILREAAFTLDGFLDPRVVDSWSDLSPGQGASWILHVVLVQLAGLLWLERLLGWWRTTAVESRWAPLMSGLCVGAVGSAAIGLWQGTVDITLLNGAEWVARGRATGLMLDANAFGFVSAIAAPVIVMVIRSLQVSYGSWLAPVSFLVCAGGVWTSGSRTALACLVVGSAFLAIGLLRHSTVRVRTLAGATLVLVIGAAGIVGLSTGMNPLARGADVPEQSAGEVVRSLWNRGDYGPIARQMFQEHPLTGVGVGTYHWLASDYLRVSIDQALPFDNAQNWWRHQLAELGMLGAAPVVVWSSLVAWLVIWDARRIDRARVTGIRGVLIGLGLVSLVGMPTQDPVVLLWFYALVTWLLVALEEQGPVASVEWRLPRTAWVAVAVLAIAYASGQAMLAAGDLSVEARAIRVGRDYRLGMYPLEESPEVGRYQWTTDDARVVLVTAGPTLVVRAWVAHPDLAEHPVRVRLSTPCQVVFDEELTTSDERYLALRVPDGAPNVALHLEVSRTWTPAQYGGADTRRLGAGVAMDFIDDSPSSQAEQVVLVSCEMS